MKQKLINLPDTIHEILMNYKEKTGISASAYIQRALYRQMINDNLMKIKTDTVIVDKETGKVIGLHEVCNRCYRKENLSKNVLSEDLKYCDGDKCEVNDYLKIR